ncbi:MAG TPA: thioredoxin domain-containing protein [Thermoanaerobaculia bacterium]|nr:thioredoxin domain-containing protein [Thermoanaerobaculia bacterium]
MMKIHSFLLLLAMATSLGSAEVTDPTLVRYITRTLPNCPANKVRIETFAGVAPKGFTTYKVTHTSADPACGRVAAVFVSPGTGQVLLSDVFTLPFDPRPLETRLAELSQSLLKFPVTTTIDSSPLPDDLWRVRVRKQTEHGPFHYHGYLDGSRRFFLVGRRGKLSVDPGTSLLEALGARNAVTRGTKGAPLQILELSDFQCPTCKRAHEALEPVIQQNLSRIAYSRLDLPLFEHHDWSMSASLGARAIQRVAPAKYWDYVDFIFENQALIKRDNVESIIRGFCEDRDISWTKVRAIYSSPEEKRKLLDQVERAFDNGVNGTPTFIVNGQFVHYGTDGEYLKRVIHSHLTQKPAAKSGEKGN